MGKLTYDEVEDLIAKTNKRLQEQLKLLMTVNFMIADHGLKKEDFAFEFVNEVLTVTEIKGEPVISKKNKN